MKSIVNYRDRGKWGSHKWRGNTSGYIIMDICKKYNPKFFIDTCEGSGTSRDVCRDLNIDYLGLDLHSGFDFTRNSIIKASNKHADIVFSHPPYHDMIKYSGSQWGLKNSNDLSHCPSVDEFLEKSQLMLLNQREATREGGHYITLIGDMRRKDLGFRSFQADYINLMPKKELVSVVIKVQNNELSSFRNYKGDFIPISHEYLLIWKKSAKSMFQVIYNVAEESRKSIVNSWRNAIRLVFLKLGKYAKLETIYSEIEAIAENLIKNNQHWKAKIRQVLQKHYINVERGLWAVY